MTRREFIRNIQNLCDALLQADIAVITNPVIENHRPDRVRVTWKPTTVGVPFAKADFASLAEYRSVVARSDFSVVLFDASAIQMSYDFDGDEVIGHRLSFYPCPVDVDQVLVRTEPVVDVVDLFLDDWQNSIRFRSPIRFDYDPDNARDGHPSSHAHFNWNHVRCPLVAPLYPSQFLRFIFRQSYPDVWAQHEWLRDLPKAIGVRTILNDEEDDLHLAVKRYGAFASEVQR